MNKVFVGQPSSEPKVKVLIPMYEPLQVSKCKKCGKIIAEPEELIRNHQTLTLKNIMQGRKLIL